MKNGDYNDDTLMPFGLFAGKRLEDVPAWYLLGNVCSNTNDEKLKAYIDDNRDALNKEISDSRKNFTHDDF